ncbi:glycosyl hydrolase family 61-domain-containing protein [Rhypophila decipiens]|uniref:lytic cellulose monooxygenase (C4-dehydrogenating) n=1 Tax=Rhypophila decipiens TaxID=261697 RepID=A0AAN7B4P2_9PEZI|nr:glycosyl hydrolase family 61-domain-containing protein [Rhypophila decipiens]
MLNKALLASLAGASLVAAHGHVDYVIIDGVKYQGYDVTSFPYQANPPRVIGWSATNTDNGFVSPDAFGTPDIICHRGAKPAQGHASVKAGSKVNLHWNPVWPESHQGPVIDYMAACNGPCETVDKSQLKWFKIDGAGHDGTTWAADALVANGNSWLVQIPADLKPGNYVLRHEIIALHGGANINGAQSYPQCFNLEVTGSGSNLPAGVPATSFYTPTDPGILFSLYTTPLRYPVPGPALIPGAVSSIQQSSSVATSTGTATPPGGAQPTPPMPTVIFPTTTTTPAVTVRPTTLQTTTTAAPPQITTFLPAPGGTQSKWGQCGGSGYTGPTACAAGSSCSVLNPYYAQCV